MKKTLIVALIAAGMTGMGAAVMAQEDGLDNFMIALNDKKPGPQSDSEFMQGELEEILTFGRIGSPPPKMDRPERPHHVMSNKNQPFPERHGNDRKQFGPNDQPGPDDQEECEEKDNKRDSQCPMQQMGRRDADRGPQMDRRGDRREMRTHDGKNDRQTEILTYLMEKYPQEMADIAQLQQQADGIRNLADTKLQELTKKAKEDLKARQEKIEKFSKMVQEYRKSKDPKILTQIETQIAEFYAEGLADMKKQIAAGEANTKEMTARLATLTTNKDQEVAKKVKAITEDKK